MFQISVRQHFDAAHYLRNYNGKCEQLHGHRFETAVNLQATELDELGMAYDFSELKKHLKKILEQFDHTCLNEVGPFDKINPSSENIAVTIYQQLQPSIVKGHVSIHSVEVWESPDSRATYLP